MSQVALFRLVKTFQKVLYNCRVFGWSRLGLLLMAAIILSFWVAARHVDADMLFQSPASPPAQPPVEQAPAAQPPVEQPPVEQAPVEQAPAAQPPVEQPPAAQPPVEQPPVEQTPVETAPGATPPVVQSSAPAAPVPPTLEPDSPRQREETPVEESGSPSNFILDQAELIDTVVVSGAYVWLCCGVSLFLLVPLALLFVYIRGRSKIIREEGY